MVITPLGTDGRLWDSIPFLRSTGERTSAAADGMPGYRTHPFLEIRGIPAQYKRAQGAEHVRQRYPGSG